jgi:hypothetical protein
MPMKEALKQLLCVILFIGWMWLFFVACFSDNGFNVLGAFLLLWPMHHFFIWLGDEHEGPRGGSPEPRIAPYDGDGG